MDDLIPHQDPVRVLLNVDEDPIQFYEITEAAITMNDKKRVGVDEIPIEFIKAVSLPGCLACE